MLFIVQYESKDTIARERLFRIAVLDVFVPDILPLFLCELLRHVCGGRRKAETHALVPAVPERGDSDVEAHAESKCASEDARHVDTCKPSRKSCC